MRAIVVDDEQKARTSLVGLIKGNFEDIEIIGEADGVESGKKLIVEKKPDLLFLDVQMQDGTGFDILSDIDRSGLQVIFVSAYDYFAITAIKFSAVDYLVKPVDIVDLKKAVDKIRQQKSLVEVQKKLDLLLNNLNKIEKIALPSVSGIEFVKIDEIVRCEAESNYTTFYLINGEKILVSRTLKEYDEILSGKGFFLIHKSGIINMKYLKKYVKGEGGTVIMEDGSELLVSRRRKEDFLAALSSF
jgi:two-component system LytT family response regulator